MTKTLNKSNSIFLVILVAAITSAFAENLHIAEKKSFIEEDKNNNGSEFTYIRPNLPSNIWKIDNTTETSKKQFQNGDILKDIPARTVWNNQFGFFPIWFGAKEYVFNSPLISGGQIMVQWKEIELEKGVYNFSKIEKMLQAYFERKLYTTIQINGNNKPDYLFREVPYLSDIKLSAQVGDDKGTLMFWYPEYVVNYKNLIYEFGKFLKKSPYLKSVIGIRFNLNAIGTEHLNIPEVLSINSTKVNPRNASSYVYPEKASKEFQENWSNEAVKKYEKAIYDAYVDAMSETVRIFLRNSLDESIFKLADNDLQNGKVGLFHTSSEPEPKTGGQGEIKQSMFNLYSRNKKTISYAEEWADCWGIHGKEEDPHFCTPQQWNYWRLLSDLNVGISHIGMYGSIWAYAFGEKAPENKQFVEIDEKNRREEIRRGIEFAFKYIGHHNNPFKSPGAFIAFRHSTENLSIKQNPEFYSKYKAPELKIFTGDYTFLCLRKPDKSVGVKLIGPTEQRYGAFARKLPTGESMQLVLHPGLAKAIYNKAVTLRVFYFDEPNTEWSVSYGTTNFVIKSQGTKKWKTAEWQLRGATRNNEMNIASIIEKGQFASNEELAVLHPDVILKALKGTPIFHMVEIDRSNLFQ
jgi:hypothetical protein